MKIQEGLNAIEIRAVVLLIHHGLTELEDRPKALQVSTCLLSMLEPQTCAKFTAIYSFLNRITSTANFCLSFILYNQSALGWHAHDQVCGQAKKSIYYANVLCVNKPFHSSGVVFRRDHVKSILKKKCVNPLTNSPLLISLFIFYQLKLTYTRLHPL